MPTYESPFLNVKLCSLDFECAVKGVVEEKYLKDGSNARLMYQLCYWPAYSTLTPSILFSDGHDICVKILHGQHERESPLLCRIVDWAVQTVLNFVSIFRATTAKSYTIKAATRD